MCPDQPCQSNANYPPKRFTELLHEINDLIADIKSLNEIFDAAGQILIRARTNELEAAILSLLHEELDPVENVIEFKIALKFLAQYGPAYFIKKILWGEDLDSFALSRVLEKIVLPLEQLVACYPMILLDQASSWIDTIKNKEDPN